jgi:hypothetical protein
MLGDDVDSERKRLDELAHEGEAQAQASVYYISCLCFDGGNHNQPVYVYIDYNNKIRPSFWGCEQSVDVQLRMGWIGVVAVSNRAQGRVQNFEIHPFVSPGQGRV